MGTTSFDKLAAAPNSHLRIATLEDIDAILAIEHAAFAEPGEKFNRRQVRALIRSRRAIAFVAELNGRAVAWAAGIIAPKPVNSWGRVYAVAVHPAVQGKKLGGIILRHLLDELHKRGAAKIFLEVRINNASAIRLYHRFGFVRCQHLTDYYGPGLDAYRMMAPAKHAPDLTCSP